MSYDALSRFFIDEPVLLNWLDVIDLKGALETSAHSTIKEVFIALSFIWKWLANYKISQFYSNTF